MKNYPEVKGNKEFFVKIYDNYNVLKKKSVNYLTLVQSEKQLKSLDNKLNQLLSDIKLLKDANKKLNFVRTQEARQQQADNVKLIMQKQSTLEILQEVENAVDDRRRFLLSIQQENKENVSIILTNGENDSII